MFTNLKFSTSLGLDFFVVFVVFVGFVGFVGFFADASSLLLFLRRLCFAFEPWSSQVCAAGGDHLGLLQLETPPALKGRIDALYNFLVNASDKLSEWESGVAALWLGVRTARRLSGLLAVAGAFDFYDLIKKS